MIGTVKKDIYLNGASFVHNLTVRVGTLTENWAETPYSLTFRRQKKKKIYRLQLDKRERNWDNSRLIFYNRSSYSPMYKIILEDLEP